MKSAKLGTDTSVEVTNVSAHGLWLLVDGDEHYLDYNAFPWFREGTIAQVTQVERPHRDHFYWPELDVDLDLDRIIHPEWYPLIAH